MQQLQNAKIIRKKEAKLRLDLATNSEVLVFSEAPVAQ